MAPPHDTPHDAEPNTEERIVDFCDEPRSRQEIMDYLGLKDRKNLAKRLSILIGAGRIAMTIPDKPKSKNQKYVAIK